MLTGLHHVQVACPAGSEDALRAFYGGVLGMTEVEKPPVLAARGGVWFRSGRRRSTAASRRTSGRPARRIPACSPPTSTGWPRRARRPATPCSGTRTSPGHRRLYVSDPVGNRLELLEPLSPLVTGAPVFLAAAFLAGAFLAAVFFAVVFLAAFFLVAGPRARRSASSSAARSMVIDSTSSPLRRLALVSPSVTYGPEPALADGHRALGHRVGAQLLAAARPRRGGRAAWAGRRSPAPRPAWS